MQRDNCEVREFYEWDVYEPGKAENPAKSEGYFEIANFACAHACARMRVLGKAWLQQHR